MTFGSSRVCSSAALRDASRGVCTAFMHKDVASFQGRGFYNPRLPTHPPIHPSFACDFEKQSVVPSRNHVDPVLLPPAAHELRVIVIHTVWLECFGRPNTTVSSPVIVGGFVLPRAVNLGCRVVVSAALLRFRAFIHTRRLNRHAFDAAHHIYSLRSGH